MEKDKIAITRAGKDLLRIIPLSQKDTGKAEIKFSFFDESFIIRKFELDVSNDLLGFKPVDAQVAFDEISYHNSTQRNPTAALLPKKRNIRERTVAFQELIDLDTKNLIVPIPICRITTNKETNRNYKFKKEHENIELTESYNTTEIYIASKKYELQILADRFPMIVDYLFPIITMDYIVYGAGFSSEPIMNKMFENNKPIVALQSNIVGEYRIFYKTYQLVRDDRFRIYFNEEYSRENFIEFFNNVEYLELLATTNISFKIAGTERGTPIKPAYQYDIEHLKKKRFYPDYINRYEKRFLSAVNKYKKMNKFRSGLLINS